MTSRIDKLNAEKVCLEGVLERVKTEEAARREAERKQSGQDKIEEQRKKAEEVRLASLTEEEKIEDEIITLKERIDRERGVYTKYIRPKEKDIDVKW